VSTLPSSGTESGAPGVGNFDSAVPLPQLRFTGERMVPGQVLEPLFQEHETRYLFAGKFVKDKVVLDVACGVGIGTHYLLKAGARTCLGLDIDGPTIAEARATYRGCRFERGDAMALSVPDNSIDVVVSFETIEHLSEASRFLSECHRVLRPGGMLICSTPNRTMSRWAPDNSHHVHEFTAAEFRKALETEFDQVELFGQQQMNLLKYAGERLLSRALHAIRVMNAAKRACGWKIPPPAVRTEYGGMPLDAFYEIQSYRPSLRAQPKYVVAVARKS